ncbi:S8 family peptidase [Shewanella sp. SM55]|uniref:S8 family peptidase n=1 Tax=Shewanella sp. SM55 TaxID=2912800 RepID=UPI0021D8EFFD|nr:S8 family peptidase [Shewanella sp. SM55]MCU8062517.1 S8 family peptidase [Shewanella sp. SM55]
MTKKKNYLIGKAEALTKTTPPPKMKMDKVSLYTWEEVVSRLQHQFINVSNELKMLNDDLCPKDYSVTKLTLHPSFISKGHFPKALFRQMGVHSIGSKATEVTPDKWTKKGAPKASPSTSIYIAGKREQLASFAEQISSMTLATPGADDLIRIWSLENIKPETKIKKGIGEVKKFFEAGIQLIPDSPSEFVKSSFTKYAKKLGFEVNEELSIEVSNLWFVPITGSSEQLSKLAEHSFIRVIRPIPQLRSFQPLVRGLPIASNAILPTDPPYASDVRVAILDGGLPKSHALMPWVNDYKISDLAASDHLGGAEHGLGVTSAFLFGPLYQGQAASRPYSYVDHHRILDSLISTEDPLELYRTLAHIEEILLSRQYEFINISLGPDLPIDDDEIHPWTSLIDTYLADGDTFLTIAAGNNGENDSITMLNRVQVPSDCVNAIAVGSATTTNANWNRASYSAVGPGRSPGRVKPDLLAFGGSPTDYFHVVNDSNPPKLIPQCGTSFSAPYLLRKAVGIRAMLGYSISSLAIKALLINNAQTDKYAQCDVGWGKVPEDINQLIESPDGVAKILYQGELSPGKYLRVPLPLPSSGIQGKVNIKATCCFSTSVDPQDTSMYTKAGVEIIWKPKFGGKAEAFFQQVKTANESELRRDAAKWESTLHKSKVKFGNKLESPAFEIHYMARDGGGNISGSKAPIIKYAFVVTLEAPKHKEIFTDILEAYSEILTEIEPRIIIPVPVPVTV